LAFTLLERLLTRRAQSDGDSVALEQLVTGIAPGLLDAASASGVMRTSGLETSAVGRRDRSPGTGDVEVVHAVAAKVLHGWLQNRHQTLYPLTVNLRNRRQEEVGALMRWAAVAVLAGGNGASVTALRDWLEGVGADAATLALLEGALIVPPPLHVALSAVAHGDLAAHAYVVAILALSPHAAPTRPFLEYVAARLALPTEVVRSANRRYRR